MFSHQIKVTGLLLAIAHCTHTFVLLTANIEDVRQIARKFVSEPLAQKIAEFITRATGQQLTNVSEENEENQVNVGYASDNEVDINKIQRQGPVSWTSKRYKTLTRPTTRPTMGRIFNVDYNPPEDNLDERSLFYNPNLNNQRTPKLIARQKPKVKKPSYWQQQGQIPMEQLEQHKKIQRQIEQQIQRLQSTTETIFNVDIEDLKAPIKPKTPIKKPINRPNLQRPVQGTDLLQQVIMSLPLQQNVRKPPPKPQVRPPGVQQAQIQIQQQRQQHIQQQQQMRQQQLHQQHIQQQQQIQQQRIQQQQFQQQQYKQQQIQQQQSQQLHIQQQQQIRQQQIQQAQLRQQQIQQGQQENEQAAQQVAQPQPRPLPSMRHPPRPQRPQQNQQQKEREENSNKDKEETFELVTNKEEEDNKDRKNKEEDRSRQVYQIIENKPREKEQPQPREESQKETDSRTPDNKKSAERNEKDDRNEEANFQADTAVSVSDTPEGEDRPVTRRRVHSNQERFALLSDDNNDAPTEANQNGESKPTATELTTRFNGFNINFDPNLTTEKERTEFDQYDNVKAKSSSKDPGIDSNDKNSQTMSVSFINKQ